MTNKETGGPAFPTTEANYTDPKWSYEGISIRDYFAAKAMLMSFGEAGTDIDVSRMATYCYEMADAMMEARK